DLFLAAMQITQVGNRLQHHLAVGTQHDSQHAMRGRMLRAHVDEHFLRLHVQLLITAAGQQRIIDGAELWCGFNGWLRWRCGTHFSSGLRKLGDSRGRGGGLPVAPPAADCLLFLLRCFDKFPFSSSWQKERGWRPEVSYGAKKGSGMRER